VPLFGRWWFGYRFTRKATVYAATLFAEPSDEEVRWLSDAATRGDEDHARWELRYFRRALGLLTAQRDALDDRTGSAVAAAVEEGFRTDERIDPAMQAVAKQQFNARLSAYSDVLTTRPGALRAGGQGPATVDERLGQMLLAFAGGPVRANPDHIRSAAGIATGYMAESNSELKRVFGVVELPEDTAPSALAR
jgi:hypothetical protein